MLFGRPGNRELVFVLFFCLFVFFLLIATLSLVWWCESVWKFCALLRKPRPLSLPSVWKANDFFLAPLPTFFPHKRFRVLSFVLSCLVLGELIYKKYWRFLKNTNMTWQMKTQTGRKIILLSNSVGRTDDGLCKNTTNMCDGKKPRSHCKIIYWIITCLIVDACLELL